MVQASLALDPEADTKIALGVEIDEQRPEPVLGEGEAEIDDRGRLARPAFLIHYRDDSHDASPRKTQELRKKYLIAAQMSIIFLDIFVLWEYL
jgi:hypothetical protein